MAYNPIGQGLAGLGQSVGGIFQERRLDSKLKGLIQGAQGGDEAALAELAAMDPNAARTLQMQQAAATEQQQTKQQQQIKNIGIIANTALGIQDPAKRRAYLIQRMNQEQDEEIKAEIADSLNMDDDQLVYDLQEAVTQVKGFESSEPKPYQMGTGDMAGYVFDPNTGAFSIDPNIKAQIDANAAELASKEGQLDAKDIASINKDITALTKDTKGIYNAAQDLKKLKEKGSAAAKLAAVFKFMKTLDPTSVVRESEQGMVYSAQGAAADLAGRLNSLVGDGRLTDEGFQDVVETAETLARSAVGTSESELNNYLDTFGETLDPELKRRFKSRIPVMSERTEGAKAGNSSKTVKWGDL